jgi:hypothetical protein
MEAVMTRHKNEDAAKDAVKEAAKEREAEMKPTPVVRESFDAMQARTQNPTDRKGTSEEPVGFQSDVDRVNRERYEAAEKKKEEDIKALKKSRDGKPIV